jgi:ADP-ribosylglycohydrolase
MESGILSAGNGAAMRVAPVGLRHATDLDGLRRAAFIAALPTHADDLAILSGILQAWGVAYCAHAEPPSLVPHAMLSHLSDVGGDLFVAAVRERRPGQGI